MGARASPGAFRSQRQSGSATSSVQVAQTFFEAATDGSDKLRYIIGEDARGFLKTRYGERREKTDEEYVTYFEKTYIEIVGTVQGQNFPRASYSGSIPEVLVSIRIRNCTPIREAHSNICPFQNQ